ncbi:MAG: helix-turn-helix transcriptional regulator [SAR324 cluster bacterium]|nr:helix-turn-helix transcriptional regulator [SAR324 cluster bacterium]
MDIINIDVVKASRLLKNIANENRLLVLCKLYQRSMTVGALGEHVKISQSALSQNLNMLKLANLIDSQRNGTSVKYSLVSEEVREIIETLQSLFGKSEVDYDDSVIGKGAINDRKSSFGDSDKS